MKNQEEEEDHAHHKLHNKKEKEEETLVDEHGCSIMKATEKKVKKAAPKPLPISPRNEKSDGQLLNQLVGRDGLPVVAKGANH